MEYQALIGGTEYSFTTLNYRRSYELIAQPFTAILPISENIASLSTVQIKRDGYLMYEGKVYEIGKILDAQQGREFVLKGYDLKRKLPFLPSVGAEYGEVWGQPSGELTNHVKDQIDADSDLTQGTLNNTTKTYGVLFGTPNAKFNRLQAVESIAQIVGWECFATPAGAVDFKAQIQTDRSATVTFKRGENLEKWIEPFKLMTTHKVEKIIVIGANIGDLMAVGSATGAGYSAGDREKIIKMRHIQYDTACDDCAAALLADWENDVYYGVFEAIDFYDRSIAANRYEVGDLINVVDDDFGVDGDYRVAWFEKDVVAEKGEVTRIAITNLSKLTLNAPFLLEGGEKTLVDAYMGVDQLGKIHHFTDSRTLSKWLLQHLFHVSFEQIDLSIWTKTGGATITASKEGGLPCAMYTTAGSGSSWAMLKSTNSYWGNTKWRLSIKFKMSTGSKTYFQIGAWKDSSNWILFYYQDAIITEFKARCKSGGSETTVNVTPPNFTSYHEFMIERLASNKVQFWIDGVVVATITTNVPSTDMQYMLDFGEMESAVKYGYFRSVVAQELK